MANCFDSSVEAESSYATSLWSCHSHSLFSCFTAAFEAHDARGCQTPVFTSPRRIVEEEAVCLLCACTVGVCV